MGGRRSHTARYPFIPDIDLIRAHNRLLRRTYPPGWRPWHPIKKVEIPLKGDYRWVYEERILHMQTVTQMRSKLKEPFGSAPRFPAKYEVRFYFRDGRFNLHLFAAKYSALKFIERVIGDREVKWLDTERLRVDDVRIESRYLEAIMNHTYTEEEAAWELPIPYSYYATFIRTGEPVGATPQDASRKSKEEPQAQTSRASRRKKRDTASDAPKTPRTGRVQSSDGTTFGIPELSTALGADASRVRGALRKSGIEKPAAGWVWPLDQKDTVIKTAKKFLK